jgi:pyruvate/2-oxoglutarate dehydrogenase complex dihydrolipoamide acyltransferase (E2) component
MGDIYNPAWRQLYIAMYARPSDSRVYGTMDVDFENARECIRQHADRGIKLTPMHLVIAALGRAIREDCPEFNCMIVRGRAVPRDGVHVSVAVSISGARGTSMTRVRDVDRRSLAEIAEDVRERAHDERSEAGTGDTAKRQSIGAVPWPLRRWLVRFVTYLLTEWGVDFPRFGITRETFGSALVSNIGTLGIDNGLLALMPVARVPVAVAVGQVVQKAKVVDGKVVARWTLPLAATFDHRLVDGAMIARIISSVRRRLEEPASLERPPAVAASG